MEKIEHPADGCRISIGGVWKILGSDQKPGFEEDFSIAISYENPVDLESITQDVAVLQDLLTATADAVSVPTDIMLTVTSGDSEIDDDPSFVQVYGQQPAYARVKESKPGDMVLRLRDLGGISSVARWFNFVRGRRVVLGLMLSSKYSQMYTENKFFNVVSAAETLHRMEFSNELRPADEYKNFRRMLVRNVPKKYRSWLSQQLLYSNEPRLRDRLIELAEYAELSSVLNCDAQSWAKAVTDARNRMVHHDKGKGPGASTVELYWLAESLRLMVLLCLAKFCEFQEGYVNKIREARSVSFLVGRVGEIMEPSDAIQSVGSPD
ncbi:HEPN domain-containing protein [Streptomyces tauricus]|uniref:HEPN domain-containing protein n=1 Tax=Streptomyces tauricus TaxID=68274 RepID=UPI0033A09C07